MNARINSDGKFWDRLIAAVIAAALAVGGTAIVFWRDTAVADSRAMDAIARIDREIDDIKRSAVVDRQKTSDLTADVKVLLAITQRVEKAVGQLNQRERSSP
jgi:hypothetical protein